MTVIKRIVKPWLIKQLRERWLVLSEKSARDIAEQLRVPAALVRIIENRLRNAVIEQVEKW